MHNSGNLCSTIKASMALPSRQFFTVLQLYIIAYCYTRFSQGRDFHQMIL